VEFSELIHKRHSIRAFSSRDVELEKIHRILEASNLAPSAGNLQAYKIYVITKHFLRKELARASLNQGFIADAPVVLVFCADPKRSEVRYLERGVRLYALQDATIACTFAMLAAVDLGLACVWVGAFNNDAVRKVIQVPEDIIPVSVLPIGYAAEPPTISTRCEMKDIACWL